MLSVLSVQDGAHRVPAGPRFLLHVYLLFSHVSSINTFKHVKDALYVILWFLYCLGFLSIEQILFVIYVSIYLSICLFKVSEASLRPNAGHGDTWSSSQELDLKMDTYDQCFCIFWPDQDPDPDPLQETLIRIRVAKNKSW